MSPFQWKLLGFFAFVFFAFYIATITVTLLLITEIRTDIDDIDYDKVTFVEAANWIYVGFLGVTCILLLIASPYFVAYTQKSESILATRLHPAGLKNNS